MYKRGVEENKEVVESEGSLLTVSFDILQF